MSVGLGLEPDDDDDADAYEPARSTEVRVRGVPGRIDDRCLRALLEAALAHGFGSPVPVLWSELRAYLERSGVAEFDFSETEADACASQP